jgi:hypothetical protein
MEINIEEVKKTIEQASKLVHQAAEAVEKNPDQPCHAIAAALWGVCGALNDPDALFEFVVIMRDFSARQLERIEANKKNIVEKSLLFQE